jgi:nucleotide-binding universal stress UspA family protein
MTLLAVAARPDIGIGMIGAPTGAAAQIADERELALYLDRLCDRLAQAGWPVNRRVMRSDQIPAAILRAAAEDDADVIAMATHGLGAAARALFGSVTAEVVRSSRLPVLIWRPAQS